MRADRQSIIFVTALLWAALIVPSSSARQAARDPEPMPGRIGMDAFIAMHAVNGALVLDVRGTDAYRAGHIRGAVHVPLDDIAARADEIRSLVKGRVVVTYCSCPDEHASLAAVKLLDQNGISRAAALVGGYRGWVEKGGKVDTE